MLLGHKAFLIVAFSLICAYAFAQTTPMTALPPAPFSFSGSWKCQGTFRGGKPHEAAFTGATVIGGKWLELTEADTLPVTGYIAKYLIGVDPEHKRLVEYDANTFIAAVYTSSEGWQGSALTMTSEPSTNPQAPYAVNRFTYTIVNQDAFSVDWQISQTVGSPWTTADHLACKRNM